MAVHFTDVTVESGLERELYGIGVAVGDYDNDGWNDLYLSNLGANLLLRNERGRFVDVSAAAGVAGNPEDWSTGTAFLDYDNDGDLDLFVGNYVAWTREIDLEIDFRLAGLGRAYGGPEHHTRRTEPALPQRRRRSFHRGQSGRRHRGDRGSRSSVRPARPWPSAWRTSTATAGSTSWLPTTPPGTFSTRTSAMGVSTRSACWRVSPTTVKAGPPRAWVSISHVSATTPTSGSPSATSPTR